VSVFVALVLKFNTAARFDLDLLNLRFHLSHVRTMAYFSVELNVA